MTDQQPQQQENSRKTSGLLASTGVVSAMTMLSRVLGLVRDIVFARLLAVSAGTDAFFIAFRIPNFLRRLFAEGAFNQAFVPLSSRISFTIAVLLKKPNTLGPASCIYFIIRPTLCSVFLFGFSSVLALYSFNKNILRLLEFWVLCTWPLFHPRAP